MRTIGLFCTGATLAWRAGRCARSASSTTCAYGQERRSYKNKVRELRMEGSRLAKPRESARRDGNDILHRAGLSAAAAAAWIKARPRLSGAFKRDTAAATKYWRQGTALLEKLPGKPKRTPEQQAAADLVLSEGRRSREEFLAHHAGTTYRRLTRNLAAFRRVDDLVYEVAKLIPGLA